MNFKVHPLIATLVIVLTILALGVWVWGSGEAKKIGGPAELRMGPNGHLYIQIHNQLLEHDADGVFLRQHDLGKIGVEFVMGAIAFFSNGDILIRRGPDPRSLSDNVRAYQRRSNARSLAPLSAESGLFRCDLEATTCERFGSTGIDFKAAHSIFIDWQTDEVYITDTTRHVLRKYSADGEELSEPVTGFKFPNQLLMQDGQLYVADTNHHQVRILDSRPQSFGKLLKVIDVVPPDASRAGQTWPSHFARVGDEWWVNNMTAAMDDGGIYVFDDIWRYSHKIALPRRADPISLIAFNGEILASDWNNDRIHRIAPNGNPLVDFASSGLDQVLAEARTSRRQFEMVSYSGIFLFAFVTAALLVWALAVNMSGRGRSQN